MWRTTNSSVTIHHTKIRALPIEIYEVIQGISPPLLNEMFVPRQCNYNFRGNNFLERRRVKSVKYDTESILFLAPKIWEFYLMKQKIRTLSKFLEQK